MGLEITTSDYLENRYSFEFAKVVEINNQFGWVLVRYLTGKSKRYNLNTIGQSFTKLTRTQKADLLLKLENVGITDAWSE